MDVTRVVVGPLATNCYVVAAGGKVVVVDPGAQPKKILKAVAGMKVAAILLTHGHPDHVGALDALLPFVAAPFFAPAGDVPLLVKYTSLDVSRLLKDGDRVAFNGASLRAVATPGHTPGSTCYYAPGILFDVLGLALGREGARSIRRDSLRSDGRTW